MGEHQSSFLRVNLVDRVINRTFGLVVRLGFGLSHNFLLEVRGRLFKNLAYCPCVAATRQSICK